MTDSNADIGIKELLEAGVHFGHQTRRWDPAMRRYIHGERDGIHIIDLLQTEALLAEAREFCAEVAGRGGKILMVGTKKQARDSIEHWAQETGMPYVSRRWLGGLLTNFQTIKKQIRRLKDLESGTEAGGEFENYTKKEQLLLTRQRDKLSKYLEGIKNMGRLPGLMFVIDSRKERIAVSEANKLGIPIVAIVDTNADPDLITVPIAGNDDAIRSVELITRFLADAIAEARREAPVRSVEDDAEESTYSSDRGLEPAAGGGDDERKRRRRPRRRRAKPEAIAARRKGGPEGEPEGDEGGAAGDTSVGGGE